MNYVYIIKNLDTKSREKLLSYIREYLSKDVYLMGNKCSIFDHTLISLKIS